MLAVGAKATAAAGTDIQGYRVTSAVH